MVFCTDIPDWVYIEAWGQAEGMARFKPRPDQADLERFHEVRVLREDMKRRGDLVAS